MRMKKINKNSAKSVTFSLVSMAHDDPNYTPQKCVLQRNISLNSRRKGKFSVEIPESLQEIFSKEDFGIHENLNEQRAAILKESIYGQKKDYSDDYKQGNNFLNRKQNSENLNNSETDLDGDCYFPKDGYDYEQHLVTINESNNFVRNWLSNESPIAQKENATERFSNAEENEIIQALENAELYEELNDDFMAQAASDEKGIVHEINDSKLLWALDKQDSQDKLTINKSSQPVDFTFANQEQKNEEKYLDQEYEDILREYDDSEIGELNEEKVFEDGEGNDITEYENALDEFLNQQKKEKIVVQKQKDEAKTNNSFFYEKIDDSIKSKIKANLVRFVEEDEYKEIYVDNEENEESKWDCETILSTKSCLSNHPFKISKPQKMQNFILINKKIGLPEQFVETLKNKNKKEKNIEKDTNDDMIHFSEINTHRRKGETKEEKKERKKQVKELKRELRKIKKDNRLIFMKEERLQNSGGVASRNPYDIQPGTRYFRI